MPEEEIGAEGDYVLATLGGLIQVLLESPSRPISFVDFIRDFDADIPSRVMSAPSTLLFEVPLFSAKKKTVRCDRLDEAEERKSASESSSTARLLDYSQAFSTKSASLSAKSSPSTS